MFKSLLIRCLNCVLFGAFCFGFCDLGGWLLFTSKRVKDRGKVNGGRYTGTGNGEAGTFKRGRVGGAHGCGRVPIPKAKKIRQKKEDV